MKTFIFPLVSAVAVSAFLNTAAAADPAQATTTAPVSTTTDNPAKVVPPATGGTAGQTNTTQPNPASPTGATKLMAPVRGTPKDPEVKPLPKPDTSSASGLTTPGASSGSSLGTGSNSTLSGGAKKGEEKPAPAKP